ncbi:hypothetical protein HAX54_015667, partial [Datura stramonium]|nr:hypothetical protein [Datura stramonium]
GSFKSLPAQRRRWHHTGLQWKRPCPTSSRGSDGDLSHSSRWGEFSSLPADIGSRYDGQELHPPSHSFPKTPHRSSDSSSPLVDEGAPQLVFILLPKISYVSGRASTAWAQIGQS